MPGLVPFLFQAGLVLLFVFLESVLELLRPLARLLEFFVVDFPVDGAADIALRPQVRLGFRRVGGSHRLLGPRGPFLLARMFVNGFGALEFFLERERTVERAFLMDQAIDGFGEGRGAFFEIVAHGSGTAF